MTKPTSQRHTAKFLDMDNARVAEQKQVMTEIIKSGYCPFCLKHFNQDKKQTIYQDGQHWILVANRWPYLYTKVHLLAIYKKHAETLAELDPQAMPELLEMFQWAEKHFNVPGGALAIRFGDTNFSAGTVKHLHAQFIQPDIDHPDYLKKPVKLKIGKT